MIVAGDFRNGVTFEMDGAVYSIIEFQHVKPGKGAAFVRTKLRNVYRSSDRDHIQPLCQVPHRFCRAQGYAVSL